MQKEKEAQSAVTLPLVFLTFPKPVPILKVLLRSPFLSSFLRLPTSFICYSFHLSNSISHRALRKVKGWAFLVVAVGMYLNLAGGSREGEMPKIRQWARQFQGKKTVPPKMPLAHTL